MDKLAFSVLNKYLLTINYVFHKHIYRCREHKTIKVDFPAGRFLRRYSFIYPLLISIPLLYYIMEIHYMNTFLSKEKATLYYYISYH